jgi:hypothetical protein
VSSSTCIIPVSISTQDARTGGQDVSSSTCIIPVSISKQDARTFGQDVSIVLLVSYLCLFLHSTHVAARTCL